MSLIAKQLFIKVSREIVGIEQKYVEQEFVLYLYETKLVTPLKTFKLNDILDVSFRKTKNNCYGTLYLHTNQGVFPFHVRSNPESFIERVKRLMSSK